nr:hypothetical protein [Tanacetum cinerariifolium]
MRLFEKPRLIFDLFSDIEEPSEKEATEIMMETMEQTKLEHEYFDYSRTNVDACQAYRELFRIMDDGWLMTKAKE